MLVCLLFYEMNCPVTPSSTEKNLRGGEGGGGGERLREYQILRRLFCIVK